MVRRVVEPVEALLCAAGEREFGGAVQGLDQLVDERGPRLALTAQLAARRSVGECGDEGRGDREARRQEEAGGRVDRGGEARGRERRDCGDRRRPAHAQVAVLELVDVDHEPAQKIRGG